MKWEYWLVIILVLLIFFSFLVMSFFEKNNRKQNENEYQKKSLQRKIKSKNKENILLNKYIFFIEEVLQLLEEFDPIKGKLTMKEINEFAVKGLNEISLLTNFKNINEKDFNWKLIIKLQATKASNWKKFDKDIKKLILLSENKKNGNK